MEWQDWHTYLDYKKVYDFLESSRANANAYVQEIWNWDSFYWELVSFLLSFFMLRESSDSSLS